MKSILSRLLHLGVTMSRSSSGCGDGIAVDEGQSDGPEVLFSWNGVSPSPTRLGETLAAALVATFLVTYDSYKKTVRREAGDDFERRPAELSEVVNLAHQDALSMYYFHGTGNLTDVQIRICLENVARIKRVTEVMNIHKIRNDLRRELTMGDKLTLCDKVAMVARNLSQCLQEKISRMRCVLGGLGRRALARWWCSYYYKV